MNLRNGVIYLEDFDAPGEAESEEIVEDLETIAPVFTEEDIARARAEGYEEGLAAGRALKLSLHEEALRQSLDGLAAELDRVREEAERMVQGFARRIAETVLGSLAAVLPEFVRRHGAEEILAMVSALLPRVALEPDLRLSVEETLVPEVKRRLQSLGSDLAGRLVLEPLTAAGRAPIEGRIEWRFGEAELALGRLIEELPKLWLRFGVEGIPSLGSATQVAGEHVHAE